MRKALVLAVALTVAVAVGASCGCGGNTDAAKSYMKKGDALLKTVESRYATISEKTTTLVTDYTAGKNTEPAGVEASINEITALLDKAKAGADAASAEYAKILTMKGVPDYVKYSALQIEVVSKLNNANEYIRSMLDIIKTSSTTGQPPDTQKLTAISSDLQKLSKQIDALMKQADELKKSKNLG